MFRKIILAALIIAISPHAMADDKSLISVTGEAELYAEPDEVNVSMTVEVSDEDLKTAQKKNDEITDKMLKIVKTKLLVDDKLVQTNYINVRPVYERNCANGNSNCGTKLTRFETQKGITITLKDITKLQDLLEEAIKAGVTRINSVNFISSKYDEVKNVAQVLAAKDARRRASEIAAALGVGIGKPYRISVDYSNPVVFSGARVVSSLAASDAVNTIAPGQLAINARVNIDFEIAK